MSRERDKLAEQQDYHWDEIQGSDGIYPPR